MVNIIFLLLFIYLAYSSAYFLLYALAGLFYKDKTGQNQKNNRIAVLIPGYREDSVIIDVAKNALRQSYPTDYYDVIVIADSFMPQTVERLKSLPIKLIEVSFDKSTKAKSLNRAFNELGDGYDLGVILDADNIMEHDFLHKINCHFTGEVTFIQGHRSAKNYNTSFAILDAISEEVNNHIFRKGHRVLGLSAALIGSGMAFDYKVMKQYMKEIKAVGGFDKELELILLRDGHTIHYLNDALVLDEKIQHSGAFGGQRRRWLSAQFIYFSRNIGRGFVQLFTRLNIDFFDKVMQLALFPRVLLLGVGFLAAILCLLVENFTTNQTFYYWFLIKPIYWYLLFGGIVAAFLLSIPRKFYSIKTLRASMSLPKGIMLMTLSLLRIRGANKKFIHTRHGSN
ncbi:MAG: glycosyltransferase [Bacteroidales bacterium]|nr:glycosyltransferase [Bacteroidales bacterium]